MKTVNVELTDRTAHEIEQLVRASRRWRSDHRVRGWNRFGTDNTLFRFGSIEGGIAVDGNGF
jgi:hypothetical protein